MKKYLLIIAIIIISICTLLCAFLYQIQEKLIFFPQKLEQYHKFKFKQPFEELFFFSKDYTSLNGLLFNSENPKGVIFYLHGNAGSLDNWGAIAKTYTDLNYDIFILDYRGFGKSEGVISNQNQLFDDNQIAYNEIKKRYKEDQIIVIGYSIGSGLAAKLASDNNPQLLILQAPYYNFTDLMKHKYPYIPSFVLKYKIAANDYLKNCKMPVVIFHGKEDDVIYYGSSLKLQEEFKEQDRLIPLEGIGHIGITENLDYINELTEILNLKNN